jgi:hypothetical protein
MLHIIATINAIKLIFINLLHFRFLAAIRLLLSYAGVKRTYLVHCAVSAGKAGSFSITFAYVARPWITYYHLGEIEKHAQIVSGHPTVKSVTIINIVRIGNQ